MKNKVTTVILLKQSTTVENFGLTQMKYEA
jgi:hypothetical protein